MKLLLFPPLAHIIYIQLRQQHSPSGLVSLSAELTAEAPCDLSLLHRCCWELMIHG